MTRNEFGALDYPYAATPDPLAALRTHAAPEEAPMRSTGRGIGRDGDTTVEAVAWPDGSFTVRTVEEPHA